MSVTALHSAKKTLRSVTIDSSAFICEARADAMMYRTAEAIVAKVIALPAFKRAETVSCYLSMPTAEVQTTALISNILADSGKKLFVPHFTSKEVQMDFVRLYDEEDFRLVSAGLWRTPEPTVERGSEKRQSVSDASCEDLDLIIVPGLAFDSSLSRLGRGQGHYDDFVSSYVGAAKRPRPLLVALSLQQQLLDAGKVPVTDLDEKMDVIITPKDIITRRDLVIE